MELMDYLIDTNIVMVENGKLVWISAEELRSKAIDLPMPDMKRSSLSDEKQSPHFAQILQLDAHYNPQTFRHGIVFHCRIPLSSYINRKQWTH